MSYGGLAYRHSPSAYTLLPQTWGWRNGGLWLACHGCKVGRELQPAQHPAIDSHGHVDQVTRCDRAGCGVEVRVHLLGWTDLDADLWRRRVTGKGDGDV